MFRTNRLIGSADYTLLPDSPLQRVGFPVTGPAGLADLNGKPITSASLSLGAFQLDAALRATLALQGTTLILNWSGAGPPYRVQHAMNLSTGHWEDRLSGVTPPLSLPATNAAGFYRVVGQ